MIKIENINDVYVRIYCEPSIAYELRDHFSFFAKDYKFHPKYKNKLWDGKIYLFNVKNHQIYRGLIPHIKKFLKSRNYEFIYENETLEQPFSVYEAVDFIKKIGTKFSPREHQLKMMIDAIQRQRALFLSPTASGKSFAIYLIVRYLLSSGCGRGLIIVPKVSLVGQLYNDFDTYSEGTDFNVENIFHLIFSGQEKISDKKVIITTWQSIYKLDESWFKNFDFVIGDEVHLFTAKSLTTIMQNLQNTFIRIGLTGTLDDSFANEKVLEGLFGTVKRMTTTKELQSKNQLATLQIKAITLKHTDQNCKIASVFDYKTEMDYLISSNSRNKFLTNLSISLDGNVLVLFQREIHGQILYEMIKKLATNRQVHYIDGNINVDERENIRNSVLNDKNAIIIASYGTYSTGINIPNLNFAIFASPSKSKIRNLQSIGRILRITDDKKDAILFDISDDLRFDSTRKNFTLKHFDIRVKVYEKEHFAVSYYNIQLKG